MEQMTIRRGGKETPSGFLFELTGGNLALDFVNTVDMRPTTHPKELLPDPHALYSWSRQAGVLNARQEESLQQAALRKPPQADRVLRKAIALRECLYKLLEHMTRSEPVPSDLSAEWNRYLRQCQEHYELVPQEQGWRWQLLGAFEEPDSVIWPVVHAAMELLTGPQAGRIRRCAAEYCDWMFLDTSKRGNRRWCDMSVCGNRAKARRFYQRSRKKKQG